MNMTFGTGSQEQRNEARVAVNLPMTISVGSQLTVQARLKDISLKSAFVTIKHSVFLEPNDQIGFAIQCSNEDGDVIEGVARISRIVPGEGFAIYFIDINSAATSRLKKLLNGQ